MGSDDSTASSDAATWDVLANELQRLRIQVGNPSFEKVAQLVTYRRLAGGAPPYAARVARSTVYDCFRTGRTRVNLPLVREIALALGATDGDVDAWLTRCHSPAPADPPPDRSVPVAGPRPPAPTGRQVLLVLLGCLALNLVGRQFVVLLGLPVHLDMVGTAIAAMALGPWRGAAVGGTTNVLGMAVSGVMSLPFALVNIVGALVWGYGVRRWGMGRTLPRFLLLNVAVALACSAVAAPILISLFGGAAGEGQVDILRNLQELTPISFVAVAASNLLVSLGDKMISGFVALAAIAALPAAFQAALPLSATQSPAEAR